MLPSLRNALIAAVARKNANSGGRSRKASRGMTLIEIMVVVVIISLVAGVVGVSVLQRLGDAQKKIAGTQVKQLSEALDLFKLSTNHYPNSGEGLQALVTPKDNMAPFLPEVPQDPWGNDYGYRFPGQHNQGRFDLWSNGPDGAEGGGDDITNWDQSAETR